jgi:uncharacterized DUF497 family protein
MYEWDEAKRASNLAKHFFTPRSGAVRIVSLRKANPREVRLYEASIKSGK